MTHLFAKKRAMAEDVKGYTCVDCGYACSYDCNTLCQDDCNQKCYYMCGAGNWADVN